MKGILEQKDGGSIKDIDVKKRKVSGYLASFGNVDSDNDIFVKGAFSKTINERKNQIFFLQQHDWSKPLGQFDELKEDDNGLYFVADVVNTSFGEDQLKLYEAGVIGEHSVGFQTIQAENPDNLRDPRKITETKLYEGSAVTLGANSNTPFLGFKTSIKETNKKQNKIIDLLKKGDLTDETFMQLEIALKQLQKHSYELGKQHSKDNEPDNDSTQEKDFEPLVNKLDSLTL